MNALNLGCGKKLRGGFVNVDMIDYGTGVDVICDLNARHFPFKDSSFDLVIMDYVFEHLNNSEMVVQELYRICKDGAKVKITAPHFASFSRFHDPSHKVGLAWDYFDFFDKDYHWYYEYYETNFKVLARKILFPRYLAWFKWFANKFHGFYETNLCYVIRPSYMKFSLKAVKGAK